MIDFQGIAAIILAVGTLPLSLYTVYRQIAADRRQEEVHKTLSAVVDTVTAVQGNVSKVEVATNHMKDALVAATAQANYLKGGEDERAKTDPTKVQP